MTITDDKRLLMNIILKFLFLLVLALYPKFRVTCDGPFPFHLRAGCL